MILATLAACISPLASAQIENKTQNIDEKPKDKCLDLREGLPTKDKYFDLKGKVRHEADSGNAITHDIIQFGNKNKYLQYFVRAPGCGQIGLYQVKTITRVGSMHNIDGMKFNVLLKNNKTFEADNNPFCLTKGGVSDGCTRIGSPDRKDDEKTTGFRYLFSDPSALEVEEGAIDPKKILQLEIFD